MDTPAIRTEGLGRTYRLSGKSQSGTPGPAERVALRDVDLEVHPGELFGLLGPNGAGKTTLIKILATLLAPTTGRAWVDGLDVVTQSHALRPRINMVSGGESCGYGVLTVEENLWLFTQVYGVPNAEAKRRVQHMLEVVGMSDRARTRVSHLSTGLRQKMNFCRGFVTDPKVLFLDEPTLGLDVTSARAIRAFVKEWLAERPGRTLLLTTHYMTEADELCDRLAVIDGGRVLACDTPAALKRRVQRDPVYEMSLSPGADGWGGLPSVPGVRQAVATPRPESVGVRLALERDDAIGAVVQHVVASGSRVLSLTKVEPTLEDVFIAMVGHGLGDDATPNGGAS
jgi:ABC-2 type transport system ATP-binding protein